MKRAILVTMAVALTGCIFGGGKAENNGSAFDLGEGDAGGNGDAGNNGVNNGSNNNGLNNGSNNNGLNNGSNNNGLNNGSDDVGVVDMGTPTDSGEPDIGGNDAGDPDMGAILPPFESVRQFALFTNAQPAPGVAAEVAMFNSGFIAGFLDTTAKQASVGWFSEDSGQALDSKTYSGEQPTFDVAGDADFAYVGLVKPQEQTMVKWAPSNGAISETFDGYMTNTTDVSYHEMSIAMERDYPYTAETREYNGSHLDIGVFGPNGYGTAADRLNYDIDDVEIIGGGSAAPNRRLLVAGRSGATYALVDFLWNGTIWSDDAYGCGPVPPGARPKRITPVFDHWVLTSAPTLTATEWRVVRCVDGGQLAMGTEIVRPSMGTVTDFDIAEETVAFRTPAVAWVEDGDAWFGILTIDEVTKTATVTDAMKFPVGGVLHVRTAYNSSRDTFAVVIQRLNSVNLVLLKRRAAP